MTEVKVTDAYHNLSIDAKELVLWAENTQSLYAQKMSIVKNLAKKIVKGTYNTEKASKLWRYWTDEAAKDYNREFGFIFMPEIRREAAVYFALTEYDSIVNNEYGVS